MKKIFKNKTAKIISLAFLSIIALGIIFQSCSKENFIYEEISYKTNFPTYAEEYGKNVSKELHSTVINLNRMRVDYSKAKNLKAFNEQFWDNLYKANPALEKHGITKDNMHKVLPSNFAEKIRSLTDIQIAFVQRIIKECKESKSYADLSKKLLQINEDIYSEVPQIQQERLFNVTAVLYYGINEIQNLERQGQLLRTPNNSAHPIRLKSGNESGGNTGSCRSFMATAWAIAVGEPTPAGEIVMSILTVGYLLYEISVCRDSSSGTGTNTWISTGRDTKNEAYCFQLYDLCYSPIPNGCGKCLEFCLRQHYWPPLSTHECYLYA